MAESSQEKQIRLAKEALELQKKQTRESENTLEFRKQLAEESARLTKSEKAIAEFLGEQKSDAKILESLRKKESKHNSTSLDTLIDAQDITKQARRDMSAKIGLEEKSTSLAGKMDSINAKIQRFTKKGPGIQSKKRQDALQQLDWAKDNLRKTEKLNQITKALPEGISSMIGPLQKVGNILKVGGPWAIGIMAIGFLIKAAVDKFFHMDHILKDIRESTGLLSNQTDGMKDTIILINKKYQNLGVTMEVVASVLTDSKNSLGDISKITDETAATMSILNANFGIATDLSADFLKFAMFTGRETENTAAYLAASVVQLSKQAGVAPRAVFQDMAQNAEDITIFMNSGTQNIIKQAVEARRLATTLGQLSNKPLGIVVNDEH